MITYRSTLGYFVVGIFATALTGCVAETEEDTGEVEHTGVAAQEARRSMDITISNSSQYSLTLLSYQADHGIYSQSPPTLVVPLHENNQGYRVPGQGSFRMESNGFMTGAEGHAKYQINATGDTISMWYDNPYAGSNAYSCTASGSVSCNWSGGNNNNAQLAFTISSQ